MDIYITRGEERYGPFSEDSIRKLLSDDELDGPELAWHEGLESWKNVKEIAKDTSPVDIRTLADSGELKEISKNINLNPDKKVSAPKPKIEAVGTTAKASAPIVIQGWDSPTEPYELPITADDEFPHDDKTPESGSDTPRSIFIGLGSILTHRNINGGGDVFCE